MEPFRKISDNFQLLTIIARSSISCTVPESIPDYIFVWDLLYYKQNKQYRLAEAKKLTLCKFICFSCMDGGKDFLQAGLIVIAKIFIKLA